MKQFVTPYKHNQKERDALVRYQDFCGISNASLEQALHQLVTSSLMRGGYLIERSGESNV